MRPRTLTTSLLGISILAGCVVVSAQSLGDIARQSRAKQAKNPPTKVWTNDNIPKASRIESKPTSPPAEAPAPETASPAPSETASKETAPGASKPSEEGQKRDQAYWQARFKAARAQLASAKEHQQLAEDELSLIQIQEVRELDPAAKKDLEDKIAAKSVEVDQARKATAKAQQALDDLQKEFDASGDPAEWSKTD